MRTRAFAALLCLLLMGTTSSNFSAIVWSDGAGDLPITSPTNVRYQDGDYASAAWEASTGLNVIFTGDVLHDSLAAFLISGRRLDSLFVVVTGFADVTNDIYVDMYVALGGVAGYNPSPLTTTYFQAAEEPLVWGGEAVNDWSGGVTKQGLLSASYVNITATATCDGGNNFLLLNSIQLRMVVYDSTTQQTLRKIIN